MVFSAEIAHWIALQDIAVVKEKAVVHLVPKSGYQTCCLRKSAALCFGIGKVVIRPYFHVQIGQIQKAQFHLRCVRDFRSACFHECNYKVHWRNALAISCLRKLGMRDKPAFKEKGQR